MKPIIGLMPLFDKQRDSLWMVPGYYELIEENGGIPLILPLTSNRKTLDYFIDYCDGFLFTGGHDLNPELYQETTKKGCGESCLKRDDMEAYCMQKILMLNKPLLGICRGIQLLNVIRGGTLYQDLPTEFGTSINHQMTAPYDRPQHEVQIIQNSLLCDILKRDILKVNSYHHQAIKKLGRGLTVAAEAADQLIEAVYLPDHKFVLALQWHPEFYEAGAEINKKMMFAFLTACGYGL